MLVKRQAIALRPVGRKSVLSQNEISKVLPARFGTGNGTRFPGHMFRRRKSF
jgi:hypothetical protein